VARRASGVGLSWLIMIGTEIADHSSPHAPPVRTLDALYAPG
jgi:hypothetical protein